jgi:glycosyltransferase involved in cell wall biosynthesis
MQKIIARVPFAFTIIYRMVKIYSYLFYFKKTKFDLTFIVVNKAWALERVCTEISKSFLGNSCFHYSLKKLPRSKAYFFSHYNKFLIAAAYNPFIFLNENFIYFTHYSGSVLPLADLGRVLNMATKIFIMNSHEKNFLIDIGVSPDKISIVFAGADRDLFFPLNKKSSRVKKIIGFCVRYEDFYNYGPRKNYELLFNLVNDNPDLDFLLIGKNWSNSQYLPILNNLSNFEYVECPYDEYPIHYNKMDVFVSVSKLEGGPLPLIEAMFCNVFPVVSNTGFAPDLINNGINGYLFDSNSTPLEVINLVKKALNEHSNTDVTGSVQHLTWCNFGDNIIRQIVSTMN